MSSRIHPPALAKRGPTDDADLEASLVKYGSLQPVVVRAADKSVIIGERRRRAARRRGIDVEVVELDVDEVEALEMRISDELAKADMPALDRAEAITELKRLLEKKSGRQASPSELAKRIGSTPSSVNRLLALADVPRPIRQLLIDEKLAPQAALELAGATKLTEQEKVGLATKMAKGTLPTSVHQAREVLRFVTTEASPDARRALTSNPSVSYQEAREVDQRRREREAERVRKEALAAPDFNVFFLRMEHRIAELTVGMFDVAKLAGEVPNSRQRSLRRQIEELMRACETFLERMDAGTAAAPSTIARIVERTEPLWEAG